MTTSSTWIIWALLSAVFASLTAIFAKIGIQDVDSDLATLIRTAIILLVLGGLVFLAGKWSNPFKLPSKTWLFLTLSSLATGASWVCYFRSLKIGETSKVAPVDKLSLGAGSDICVCLPGRTASPPRMDWDNHGRRGGDRLGTEALK